MVAAKVKDMVGKLSFAGKVWLRSKLRLATQNKTKMQALMDKEMEARDPTPLNFLLEV